MTTTAFASDFQIRFPSFLSKGRTVAFPCDALGNVDLDALNESGRREYLFARIMTRRERRSPQVVRVPQAETCRAWPVCSPATADS